MNILPLADHDKRRRDDGLALASRLLNAHAPFQMYKIQALYDVTLTDFPDNGDVIDAVGCAFGEYLVRNHKFEWVSVDDEFENGPSVAVIGYCAVNHPLAMMHKRIDRRERANLQQLCEDTVWTLESRIERGEVADRETTPPLLPAPLPLFRRIRLALRRWTTRERE